MSKDTNRKFTEKENQLVIVNINRCSTSVGKREVHRKTNFRCYLAFLKTLFWQE